MAALLDAGRRFEFLPAPAHWGLLGGAGLVLGLALHRRTPATHRSRRIVLVLSGAAFLAGGARLSLQRNVRAGPGSAARAAERVDQFLADLTRETGDAAYLIARAPNIAAAVEGSDASDTRAPAFRALSAWPLPATRIGPAGATLYDRGLRPVAWSDRSSDLEEALAEFFPEGVRGEDCPDPAFPLFVYSERGRRGYLAAAECTPSLLGLVTVEVPLWEAPAPSTGAPPVSALEAAARRGLDVQILSGAEDPAALARLFERRGGGFLDGQAGQRRYYFALRAYDGQLLGAASTAVAPEPARRAERRAEAAFLASVALLLGALATLPGLWRTGAAGALASIWTTRFSLSAVLETLAPASESPPVASALLPGLSGSPLIALLTAVALFWSVRVLQPDLRRLSRRGRSRPFALVLRGAGAGAAAACAAALVRSAGESGAAPLAPTWTVGVGWPEILGWTALLLALASLLVLTAALLGPEPALLAAAGAVVLVSALLESSLLFAAVPLAGLAAVSGWRRGRIALRRLRRPLLSHEPGFSFVVAFLLFAIPPALLHPALVWREEDARRRYASDAAPVQVLRHRFAVCHALEEAARALDARTFRLRPDTAYRLWLSTGLPRLTVASALEVRGPTGQQSRFGVGLSRRPDPLSSAAAPPDWSEIPGCRVGGAGDAILETRRRFPSGVVVTIRAADRAAEIPFLPRAAGIADHFLLRGDAAPAVFRGRDLRLRRADAPDGRRAGVTITVAGEPLTVSWLRSGPADHAAALLGWVFLAALVALLIALAARLRLFLPGPGGLLRRRSFQMQLTETLAAAVLVAIIGLALFTQQRLGALLDAADDREALSLARSVERVARELGALDPSLPAEELVSRLAHAADQLDTDAALYTGGALLAVSRPELAQTGLLPPRAPPAALLSAGDASVPVSSIQEAGPLRYRIVWIRLDAPTPIEGPLLLAAPLPAREAERLESVRAIQRTLLLGSGSVALLFAIVLPGLVARRLAAPVRGLAQATGRIADGDLEAPVPVHGALTELRLLAASVERLVRRIPGVRRRMREEAAADLARRVAHDVKNALAPIALAADYIRRVLREPRGQDPGRAVDESVGEILGQVERLRRISSEFSALGAPLRIETMDLTKLVRDTVAPWVRAYTGPRVGLEGRRSLEVRADPEIVARIVENLLQNAVEATQDAPGDREGEISVRVAAAEDRRWARIEVEDNGPGVAETLRERIFDAAFSTRTRGSGLGLANARRFVEAHGGRVRAGPRADGRSGLLLRVELPVAGPGA